MQRKRGKNERPNVKKIVNKYKEKGMNISLCKPRSAIKWLFVQNSCFFPHI
ncbi:hypothetical protein NSS60_06495 [Anoxybacillus sp. FSL W8-0382]|uniref:Uncharacterized protein n=1 Tax=Anoxybacillus flavithermus TaxID=33934 RepID=A0A178TBY0_9BACL|nr:hypothetical protein [Anoxybacillus flavithermus]MBE2904635.1 hypothetical protein [Anoxybacillus flavithermus]MBE2912408.1 hypothetical protein [Anoxybacillus flavithermus]MBE2931550.1 hypothetical protein [Anoxybacillus flavithermus]OAO78609.1 hypothetical protein TAF16_1769 [Anoxybacillus flavithermus]OAO78883.1 hypothetical protein A0O32_2074 [Anoxybacillus flavithermus]